jgi:oxygen-independent coproporphyrinogen-3 oxidase
LRQRELGDQPVETIYLGGGTPSLLNLEELDGLLETIYCNYHVIDAPEITLEANPDDLSEDYIDRLSKSPVNRLSIGIQSFFDKDLQSMNRAHDAREATACLEMATEQFDNVSVDLIYGIPEMSLKKWDENLQKIFYYRVNHISAYALTVEPRTALDHFIKKGKHPPIDEALASRHFGHLISESRKHGFVQYEISNFGKPGYFSKHNTAYWQGQPYLGIGPSAHSFDGRSRAWNVSNNSKYIASLLRDEIPSTIESLSVNDRYNEYIMTGLRTVWGISLDKVGMEFGTDFKSHLLNTGQRFLDEGLITLQGSSWTISDSGKFLVDGIASELFVI